MKSFNGKIIDKLLIKIAEIQARRNPRSKKPKIKNWGDLTFASQITGYLPRSLEKKASLGQVPKIEIDGVYFFERTSLIKWVETGIVEDLEAKK
jgi:hypothetical protein